MPRNRAPWVALLASVICGCGLVLDVGGEGEPGERADGSVLADGRIVGADGSGGGGPGDGAVAPVDGSAPGDGAAGPDGAATDGATGLEDGTVARIDAGPCAEDAREDDDDLTQAMAAGVVTEIAPGRVDLGSLTSCPGDDDVVYAYSDCCEYERGAVVMYDPRAGRLALEGRAGDGSPWGAAATETEPGRLELLTRGTGGYFYVTVRNESGTPVPYGLTVYAPVYGP